MPALKDPVFGYQGATAAALEGEALTPTSARSECFFARGDSMPTDFEKCSVGLRLPAKA
jgi:hypothetical protein